MLTSEQKGGPEWLFRLARERSVHSDLDFTGRQDVDSKGALRRVHAR